jgi:predicted Zn-dependent peptidase
MVFAFSFIGIYALGERRQAMPAAGGMSRLSLPAVDSYALENGLRCYYVPDELPSLLIVASIGYGTLYETRQTAGLSQLMAKTISIAGTRKYPGKKLIETVDAMGGHFSITASFEGINISFKVLDRFSNEAFDIVSDVIANPNFEDRYVSMAKSILASEIMRKNDDTGDVAFEKARELLFDGDGYGSVAAAEKIDRYSVDLIKETWRSYASAKNIMLGITSKLGIDEVKALTRRHMAGVDSGVILSYSSDAVKIKGILERNRDAIFLLPRQVPQSTVVFAAPAPDIRDDGVFAQGIMNYILGGGSFTSRLVQEIRVRRGLAYSCGSVLRSRADTGVFFAFAQTDTSSVPDVIDIITNELNRICGTEPSNEEMFRAKRSTENSYIFRFDTPEDILLNEVSIAYNRLPADYTSVFLRRISGVSAAEIPMQAKRLMGSGFIRLVVGERSLAERLSKYGRVVVLTD